MEVVVITLLFMIYCIDVSDGSAGLAQQNAITTISRLSGGDIFGTEGANCSLDTCIGLSSGTAVSVTLEDVADDKGPCTCQCHRHLPTFREDLHLCVDDIHECVLAPFVSGSTSQKIPFVFLPLKGQIIHPSKEINFTGVQTPICAVSGAKFLTDSGWSDLRSSLDADVPFRLFRDEGHTYLQWIGEGDLRTRLTGRLVLVHMLCRELPTTEQSVNDIQSLFTPCVAFRIVGSPTKYLNNVNEVSFSPGAHASENDQNDGLSVSEYLTIGICSIMLGLIYVASVFLYLHFKKRKKENRNTKERRDNNHSLINAEEGIVKSNPLLDLGRNFPAIDSNFSDSGGSDTDIVPDLIQQHEERQKNIQIMSAIIHPHQSYFEVPLFSLKSAFDTISQDSSNMEKLPEENVSIVETLEGREDRSDTMKAITGTTRKKLYFNPAYFELELLLAPPPAAIEFLTKIREVICIAKQKMACKRFIPSLLGIPEEEQPSLDSLFDQSKISNSRRGSMISLKRENSRRRTCAGCPGCEPRDLRNLCGRFPEFPTLTACKTCAIPTTDSKQRSIEKWLEDVPILKPLNNSMSSYESSIKSIKTPIPKRVRSPTRSLSPEYISQPYITVTPRPASEKAYSSMSITRPTKSRSRKLREVRKAPVKPKAPPPPIPIKLPVISKNLPPPDMINEAMVIDSKIDPPQINSVLKNEIKSKITPFIPRRKQDYESDSLERSGVTGYSTPSEYADASSQSSPSLSTALPLAEEVTITNAILNTTTGNMTISRLKTEPENNPEYELVLVKTANTCNLPELLQPKSEYSFVSEVYVNNGYNNGSNPSSPCDSNCSTLDGCKSNIKYTQPNDKPGQLTIEVEDCPDNYIRIEDSDEFEPDTLDRKPINKFSVPFNTNENEFIDSLERPNHILLRTTGSFKNNSVSIIETNTPLNRCFGSLREIYEFKSKATNKSLENLSTFESVSHKDKSSLITWKNAIDVNDEKGKLLTLEDRHSKRQRRLIQQPPDVIPPLPLESSFYEHPKPPRKVTVDDISKPPLPPKNGNNRSISKSYDNVEQNASPTYEHSYSISLSSLPSTSVSPNSSDYETYAIGEVNANNNIKLKNMINDQPAYQGSILQYSKFQKKSHPKQPRSLYSLKKLHRDPNNNNMYTNNSGKRSRRHKHIDSGYLSTDSSEPQRRKKHDSEKTGSESDESFGDGHSESGAESIETHSVFFNCYRKSAEDATGKNTDNVSYATVIPESTKCSILVN